MAKGDGFDFDPKAIERLFTGLAKDVLPTAQAGLLNGLAFAARKALIKHAEDTIEGKPTPFTKRAFVVDKAVTTSPSMTAVVKSLPTQARYLQYLINGGERRAGDPGAGKYDVLVDGDDKTAFGNLRRGYLKRIARKAKSEKTRRAKLREQRNKAREAGKDIKKFSWTARSKDAPGIFFGEINGTRGYWQRPSSRDAAPGMLVRFSDSARYKPTFLWDKEINKAVIIQNPSKTYAAELERAMKRLKP